MRTMVSAKEIRVAPISRRDADRVVRRWHYSGKVVNNSQISLGVFLGDALLGAMQFGPPMDRAKMLSLVRGARWPNILELNRMAFSDALPRNSESRSIAVACRELRKRAPQVKFILSFSDATQCGDGTIYRASGFLLTGIKRNTQIIEFPDGSRESRLSLSQAGSALRDRLAKKWGVTLDGGSSMRPFFDIGAQVLPGYQLRYIRFIDPEWIDRLAVPVIPFNAIPDDARMYRGEARRPVEGAPSPGAAGGADPTPALHVNNDGAE